MVNPVYLPTNEPVCGKCGAKLDFSAAPNTVEPRDFDGQTIKYRCTDCFRKSQARKAERQSRARDELARRTSGSSASDNFGTVCQVCTGATFGAVGVAVAIGLIAYFTFLKPFGEGLERTFGW